MRVALVAVVLLLNACTSAPVPPPPPPVPDPCLKVTTGIVDAALGFRQMGLELANCGGKPFEVNGYPAIKFFDAEGNLLDLTVGHSATDDPGAKPLTIRPAERLVAHLSWRNTVTDIDRVPYTATALEIAPLEGMPGQKVDPKTKLDLGNTSRVDVTAWMPKK
ncbi:DUF4232 domain-containing protein [Allokutzneria sp. A3M-2-11 16]|uniref:DUF4232 domain-containing protein n=1 Tax=Allokutzneria sp. A3M-2-11 16 TaxID=2962043 RepID=UPI0020B8CE62|nr:DUF4232 domain-containing protein [Allokutzneria sp. A3M-2-11 16]MCP3803031.1 DUF4232 domain-containing protein [Allokutzneria sp. A3M-2-11 16]